MKQRLLTESEGAQYLQSCLAICASRTLADTRTEERRDRERERERGIEPEVSASLGKSDVMPNSSTFYLPDRV